MKTIQVALTEGSGTARQARTLTGKTDIAISIDGVEIAKVKVSAAGLVTQVIASINGTPRTLSDGRG